MIKVPLSYINEIQVKNSSGETVDATRMTIQGSFFMPTLIHPNTQSETFYAYISDYDNVKTEEYQWQLDEVDTWYEFTSPMNFDFAQTNNALLWCESSFTLLNQYDDINFLMFLCRDIDNEQDLYYMCMSNEICVTEDTIVSDFNPDRTFYLIKKPTTFSCGMIGTGQIYFALTTITSTEDYTINVTQQQGRFTDLVVVNPTNNSSTINLAFSEGSVEHQDVYYRLKGEEWKCSWNESPSFELQPFQGVVVELAWRPDSADLDHSYEVTLSFKAGN